MENPNPVASEPVKQEPHYVDTPQFEPEPAPAPGKTVPLLLGVVAVLMVAIVILLGVILTRPAAPAPDIKPIPTATPEPTVVVYTETPKPTVSTTASATPTPTPKPWTNLSYTVVPPAGVDLGFSSKTITGSFPGDTVISTKDLDAAGVKFTNKDYTFMVYFPQDGGVAHYASYKTLPLHEQFGQIFRIRFDEQYNGLNTAYYVSGPVTTSGGCNYIGDTIVAPCGGDLLNGMSIRCQASLDNRNAICDKIVASLRVN